MSFSIKSNLFFHARRFSACAHRFYAVRSLNDIVKSMETRRAASIEQDFKKPEISYEFKTPAPFSSAPGLLHPGDIVLVQLEPMVLLSTPNSPKGVYTVVDRVGRAIEVASGNNFMRVSKLIPPALLAANASRFYASTVASIYPPIEASGPIADNSSPEIVSADSGNGLNTLTTKVVSSWVYDLVSQPLRLLTDLAFTEANGLVPKVSKTINELQELKVAGIIPFSTYLAQLYKRNVFSPIEVVAARICLDHESVCNKYNMDLSCVRPNTLCMIPKPLETYYKSTLGNPFKPMVKASVNTDKLVKDYACNNISYHMYQSRAIEELKTRFPDVEDMNPSSAAEMLNLPFGGVYDSHWYNWILQSDVPEIKSDSDSCQARQQFVDPVYCIDAKDAKEIDDGISIKQLDSQKVRLGIHAANPSAFVNPKTTVDLIKSLPSSVYFAKEAAGYEMQNPFVAAGSKPMMPRSFTEQFDVSKPGAPALGLFVDFNLETGELSNLEVKHVCLKSPVSMEPDAFSAKTVKEYHMFMQTAQKLMQLRYANGAFGVKTYTNGSTGFLDLTNTVPGTTVVTEFMLLANHLVAAYCQKNEIPIFYRGQSIALTNDELKTCYKRYYTDNKGLLGFEWSDFLNRGFTSAEPVPHNGIGYNVSSRFTSPLRRMDDFITHAQLDAFLNKKKLPFSKPGLQDMEAYNDTAQYWIKNFQNQEGRYYKYRALKDFAEANKGTAVKGVVFRVDPLALNTVEITVYLPEFGVKAVYLGTKRNLCVEDVDSFIIDRVSPEGMYAHVI